MKKEFLKRGVIESILCPVSNGKPGRALLPGRFEAVKRFIVDPSGAA